jgi:hypothetical protein
MKPERQNYQIARFAANMLTISLAGVAAEEQACGY